MTGATDRAGPRRHRPRVLVGALGVMMLAACAKTVAPPPPPPPPPPVQIVVPPRPVPPLGATQGMIIPRKVATGTRQTVNAFITPMQATWNVRSAFNVAALNCLAPQYQPILTNYQTFLTRFKTPLTAANRTMSREFAAQYGREGRAAEDAYLTKVYNYFSMPQVQTAFCDRVLGLSGQANTVAPADLNTFAAAALPSIEQVFEQFFVSYERYEQELAAWEAKYGVHGQIDPYALQRAVAATPPPIVEPRPLPTAGPILR